MQTINEIGSFDQAKVYINRYGHDKNCFRMPIPRICKTSPPPLVTLINDQLKLMLQYPKRFRRYLKEALDLKREKRSERVEACALVLASWQDHYSIQDDVVGYWCNKEQKWVFYNNDALRRHTGLTKYRYKMALADLQDANILLSKERKFKDENGKFKSQASYKTISKKFLKFLHEDIPHKIKRYCEMFPGRVCDSARKIGKKIIKSKNRVKTTAFSNNNCKNPSNFIVKEETISVKPPSTYISDAQAAKKEQQWKDVIHAAKDLHERNPAKSVKSYIEDLLEARANSS